MITRFVVHAAGTVAFRSAQYGAGVGRIYFDTVACAGTEARLIDCNRASSVSCFRGHAEDAGVRCQFEGVLIPVILKT